jgi:leader peptidase (prepilin peptidase)/N-methyltransferase
MRSTLAVVAMTLAALSFVDVTCLVIPDLYIALLAVTALVGPLAQPWDMALIGATVLGLLLFGVRWWWRRRTGTEGLGLGDVKLAVVLGGIFGARDGLLVVAAATGLGAAGMLLIKHYIRRQPSEQMPAMAPLGAGLALVALVRLGWSAA